MKKLCVALLFISYLPISFADFLGLGRSVPDGSQEYQDVTTLLTKTLVKLFGMGINGGDDWKIFLQEHKDEDPQLIQTYTDQQKLLDLTPIAPASNLQKRTIIQNRIKQLKGRILFRYFSRDFLPELKQKLAQKALTQRKEGIDPSFVLMGQAWDNPKNIPANPEDDSLPAKYLRTRDLTQLGLTMGDAQQVVQSIDSLLHYANNLDRNYLKKISSKRIRSPSAAAEALSPEFNDPNGPLRKLDFTSSRVLTNRMDYPEVLNPADTLDTQGQFLPRNTHCFVLTDRYPVRIEKTANDRSSSTELSEKASSFFLDNAAIAKVATTAIESNTGYQIQAGDTIMMKYNDSRKTGSEWISAIVKKNNTWLPMKIKASDVELHTFEAPLPPGMNYDTFSQNITPSIPLSLASAQARKTDAATHTQTPVDENSEKTLAEIQKGGPCAPLPNYKPKDLKPYAARLPFKQAMLDAANRTGIDPAIIETSIALESEFDPLKENYSEKVVMNGKAAPDDDRWGKGICQLSPLEAQANSKAGSGMTENPINWYADKPDFNQSMLWLGQGKNTTPASQNVWNPYLNIQIMADYMKSQLKRDDYEIKVPSVYETDSQSDAKINNFMFKRDSMNTSLSSDESKAELARYLIGKFNRGDRVVKSLARYFEENGHLPASYGELWQAGSSLPIEEREGKHLLYGQDINRRHIWMAAGLCGTAEPGSLLARISAEYKFDEDIDGPVVGPNGKKGRWVSVPPKN